MTKRSSKKVLKDTSNSTNQPDVSLLTSNNTNNFDHSSSSNPSSNSIPSSTRVTFTRSKENRDVILETGTN